MSYCIYYQAKINREMTWFLVAVLRSYEHLSFDRTLDKAANIFEFFVPPKLDSSFIDLMNALVRQGVVVSFEQKPNRLMDPTEIV